MAGKIKLLIADDQIRFLNSLAVRLQLRGFDVTKATNGEEALHHANEQAFDLALVDLKMPGIDGEEVLGILKKRHHFIEVIIMTGHGSSEAAVACLERGVFSYLPKPYELETILEILRQAYAARLRNEHGSNVSMMERLADLESKANPVEALSDMKELAG